MSDRFVTPCDLPNEHERELLTILMEECSEASIRASKMLRFGRDEIQPGQGLGNDQRLAHEIGDIYAMVDRLMDVGLVKADDIRAGKDRKEKQLARYMQTSAGA